MPLRAVLFDLDDTLTDRHLSIARFAPLFHDRFRAALQPLDTHRIVQCMIGGDANGYAPRRDLAAHLQSSLPWRAAPDIDQLVNFWHENFPACAMERSGVTATLQALHRAGLKLGVVTNGTPGQHVKLKALGIGPMLSVVVSAEFGCKKPDPAIFHAALNSMRTPPSETIFVGDNPELDICASRAIGMRPIWLRNGRDWPTTLGPEPNSITTFEQLLAFCEIG